VTSSFFFCSFILFSSPLSLPLLVQRAKYSEGAERHAVRNYDRRRKLISVHNDRFEACARVEEGCDLVVAALEHGRTPDDRELELCASALLPAERHSP